jgi:hypothetical protein
MSMLRGGLRRMLGMPNDLADRSGNGMLADVDRATECFP